MGGDWNNTQEFLQSPPPLFESQKEVIYTTKKKILSKEERIAKEKRRLNTIYKEIEERKKKTVEGLIERCAYMRVTLEDLEKDLDLNGFTEKFSQGNQKPYDRKRPAAEIYQGMNTSYQKGIKQLSDLIPKDTGGNKKDDGFEEFVNGREDV